jgi:putative nucleotidyltransferase-like protein
MSSLHPDLPPFATVQSALVSITERFAREILAPEEATPDWNDFEWGVARAVCVMHGLAGMLAGQMRWRGPDSWQKFLAEQLRHIRLREARARELLARLHETTRAKGVAVVPLKGSALLALGVHREGVRPMSDIDLLVAPEKVAAVTEALDCAGYRPWLASRRHTIFVPVDQVLPDLFGEHVDNSFRIELHLKIAEPLPISAVDITDVVWPSDAQPGANKYANNVALFCHLMLHATGGMRTNTLRFMQLIDLARFAPRLTREEWDGLTDIGEHAWWMYPVLRMVARYFPGVIPADALAATRHVCPPLLLHRCARHDLARVSWTNLSIPALPGYEWSRTPLELLRYARSRVLPDRQALAEIADAAAHLPALRQVPWYNQSHFTRILRWVTSRPPRVQTIATVLAGQAWQ